MAKTQRIDGQRRPDLPASHYLDNRIYTDQDVFQREQQRILAQCWRFVCHASELRQKLAYRLVEVAGHELIILRDDDNVLRALYNSCAHRGAKILKSPAGRLDEDRMTCFYHLWSFNSKGDCLTVSQPGGYKGSAVQKDNIALKSVRLETVYDLVFVCLDDAAPSLAEFLGADLIEAMRVPFGSAELEVFHFHRSEIQANWKLFVETNREGYHELLHLLNRTTAVARQDYRGRQWRVHRNGHLSFDPAKIGYENLQLEQRKINVLPGMEANGHVVINLFPDMMLNCRSTVVRIDSVMAIAPGRSVLECRGLGVAGDPDEVRLMRIRHHNQVWGPMGVNLAEDIWAVETQMQNMQSGNGRFSIIAREEEGAMSDVSLRSFYAEWSRLSGLAPHDVQHSPMGD